MPDLPRGTVAFLFTDIEGSTRLWQAHPEAMHRAYARHDAILRGAIARHGGVAYKTVGDAFQAAFPTAPAAVAAACEAQQGLVAEDWSAHELPEPLRVRMALHAGAVDPDGSGDYRSPVLNRLGRLLGAGHGDQVLLSQAVCELARDELPAGAGLLDLGEQRLKDLGRPERVWQLLHPNLPPDFPPLATLARTPNNLPAQPTPLVGRERELSDVQALLAREDRPAQGAPGTRLVTLTGPGGIGKTRLALQVAADLLDRFPDGAWFVDLASVRDPALVPAAVAAVLGVREEGGRALVDLLAGYLRDRRLLLVLDNFEQVIDGATLVAELLAAAAGLKVLATSRVRLALRGEHEVAVPPLALPERPEGTRRPEPAAHVTQYAAVRLFIQRAQAAKPGFAVDNASAPAVAEVCHRLDGLPLAIELAAARVRLFGPEALLARLERRLPFLTGGPRDLPERQRTLRDAIVWSHDLLTPEGQAVFRRLAVFAGGFDLEAAAAIAAAPGDPGLDILAGVADLADQSLLRPAEGTGSEPRFAMLETIREFGLEMLEGSGEEDQVRTAHLAHFLALAEQAEPELARPEQRAWAARLEAEHDNLRATLGWAVARDPEAALRLVGALFSFWWQRSHIEEARRWAERALLAATGGPPTRPRGKALLDAGDLAAMQGDYGRAEELAEEALALFRGLGDAKAIAGALVSLGNVASARGDLDRAAGRFTEALEALRALEHRYGVAAVLTNLGQTELRRGDLARARELGEEALAAAREIGAGHLVAEVLVIVAAVLAGQRDAAGAAAAAEEALGLARDVGDKRLAAEALFALAEVARLGGEEARSPGLVAEAAAAFGDLGDREGIARCLEATAALLAARAEVAGAVRALGAAAALREAIGAPLPPADRPKHEQLVTEAGARLGEGAYAEAWEAGRALPLEQAVAEALAAAGGPDPRGDDA
jgi:predicted ATPase/class 3 adenylate cyclase